VEDVTIGDGHHAVATPISPRPRPVCPFRGLIDALDLPAGRKADFNPVVAKFG